MKSTATIRGRQLIAVLFVSRTVFSTCFIPAVNPSNNIQDMLLAVPVVFLINLIIAVPVLALLKRHPGRDFIECSMQACGKIPGYVICLLIYFYIVMLSGATLATFCNFYINCINSEMSIFIMTLFILLVAIYGAVKGIETIARYAFVVVAIYFIIVIFISITLIPSLETAYLTPLFYNGSRVFTQTVLSGVNASFQLMLLAMCTPFLQPEQSVVKTYVKWDILSMVVWLFTLFLVVVVMGPYGGKQLFPLGTLVTISKISSFERLDSFDLVSWIMETVLDIAFYLFIASQCLKRTAVRKWRRTGIFVTAALFCVVGLWVAGIYTKSLKLYYNPYVTAATVFLLFLLPLVVLLADMIRERVSQNG